jgi:hypothetical protein
MTPISGKSPYKPKQYYSFAVPAILMLEFECNYRVEGEGRAVYFLKPIDLVAKNL